MNKKYLDHRLRDKPNEDPLGSCQRLYLLTGKISSNNSNQNNNINNDTKNNDKSKNDNSNTSNDENNKRFSNDNSEKSLKLKND